MGVIESLVLVVLALISAQIARIVGNDVEAWLPEIAKRLLDAAVRRLPDQLRNRYHEEWSAGLNDTPGNLSKILIAARYLYASRVIARVVRRKGLQADLIGTPVARFLKRAIDLSFAGSLMIGVLPVFLIIAVLIRLTSKGPIFFRATRTGIRNQPFQILKFRTLRINDNQVTLVGAWLRRTSLDELPQLLNVVRGSMSLVGPRPRVLAESKELNEVRLADSLRWRTKPGITGLAQLNCHSGWIVTEELVAKRDNYDMEYVKNWSLGSDLRILWRTALLVFFDKNAF